MEPSGGFRKSFEFAMTRVVRETLDRVYKERRAAALKRDVRDWKHSHTGYPNIEGIFNIGGRGRHWLP